MSFYLEFYSVFYSRIVYEMKDTSKDPVWCATSQRKKK